MITLHAFANMFPGGIVETKDLRVQWALEEIGVPYDVRAWDYNGGETTTPAFTALNPFNQLPMLEDDGVVITETAAILIHLAETTGRLTPPDAAGRAHVRQWTIAAMATVAPAVSMLSMVDAGFMGSDPAARTFLADLGRRWMKGLQTRLEGRDWIAADDFTVADVSLAGVLREARDTELMDDFPAVRAFYARAHARPAWTRARELYAERMGVPVDRIA